MSRRDVDEDEQTIPSALFTYDPTSMCWRWKEELFTGKIDQDLLSNHCHVISIPACAHAKLNWQPLLEKLPSNLILWSLDLELFPMSAPLTDEACYSAHKLTLEHFTKTIFANHREKSLGVILYEGDLSFKGFYFDLETLEQFSHYLNDRTSSNEIQAKVKNLLQNASVSPQESYRELQGFIETKRFILELFLQYLHFMASALDSDCPLFINLKGTNLKLEEQIFLLASPIWESIHLIGESIHPKLATLKKEGSLIGPISTDPSAFTLGLLIPSSSSSSLEVCQTLAKVMEKLDREKAPYRIIYESRLSDLWQGLDELLIMEKSLSLSGKRMLRGFEAAQGKITRLDH